MFATDAPDAPLDAAYAFILRNLTVLAYANGFTLWHYKAGRTPISAVAAEDFFAPAADMLNTGDMVMVSASDGGAMLCVSPTPGQMLRLA